jgi:hypothetical protein
MPRLDVSVGLHSLPPDGELRTPFLCATMPFTP